MTLVNVTPRLCYTMPAFPLPMLRARLSPGAPYPPFGRTPPNEEGRESSLAPLAHRLSSPFGGSTVEAGAGGSSGVPPIRCEDVCIE